MPTYQYACTNAECANRFERVQAFTDPAVTECPVCESPVRKVYGSVGVVFKGSGFYRTDSRASSGAGSGASDGAKSKETAAVKFDSGSSAGGSSSNGSGSSGGSDSSGSSTSSGSGSSGTSGSSGKAAASA